MNKSVPEERPATKQELYDWLKMHIAAKKAFCIIGEPRVIELSAGDTGQILQALKDEYGLTDAQIQAENWGAGV